MGEVMMFPDTVEEFMEQYKIVDREQVYTNGTELVPIFRMKQWFAHKRGRWISQKEEDWAGGGVTRCSRCNFGYAWGAFHEVEEFNYCPNCGARMEASDD